MTNEEWAPPGIDTTRPSVARVYDYMLGGKDNFAIDRHVAQLALQITPDGPEAGRVGRLCLQRMVRYLTAEAGIRQFLDIGSGLPTQGNVHEIATAVDPTARVVYVDNDPMVLAHGRALLTEAHTTTVIHADAKEPESILEHPEVKQFIDFSQPVGLLLFAILHHFADSEDPGAIAKRFIDRLPAGSYVAISHFRDPAELDPAASAKAKQVEKIFNESLGTGRWRTQEEILSFFGDLELVEPGLVPMADWRPDEGAEPSAQTDTYLTFVGGLAKKN